MATYIKYVVTNVVKAKLSSMERARPATLLPGIAQLDEQWAFVTAKSHPHWLWVAICQYSGEILAFIFGDRTDQSCERLLKLLAPFNITCHKTDD